ncbi:MAG: hypothetical protein A2600_09990 [Candidatus Lambdaproteobacteria bacterium RIFOXYD1_FULL_56_27]|uniref:KAP NTPase domain-containing protein n=1 Tax=Candidatus Lambdaproteobacteria bacterium RIFOXYD2_FULL_56_26 TaxID=1817773 RepID=A0A1F6GUJ8_9PROT|nr:MAG: hypothetical protein A2557_11700 [Candidatus Lambdaproteobacteria bacterium RIFOXYD2_FULL_56_26]OGH07410.1 MAG: hypothetical protein A2600_09990 [Candidatus Lambdaproteobacteria bacterium RIFOXYD1_FULL_56_27]
MTPTPPLFAPDPFLLDKDAEAKALAEPLADLLSGQVRPPYSVSIHGDWGTGKTRYLLGLKAQLEAAGHPVFWFNPWEWERAEDLLFAFLSDFVRYAKPWTQTLGKELLLQAVSILGAGADIFARVVTGGNANYHNVKEIGDDFRKGFEDAYAKQLENNSVIGIVKKDFAKLTQALAQSKGGKPLVIFLDDLDRCLPERALEMLDAMKNLFLVQGAQVIFVTGIDSQVAKQFIQSRYKDLPPAFAHQYFKKVFNLTLPVPAAGQEDREKRILERLEGYFPDGWPGIKTPLPEVARSLETILTSCHVKSWRILDNVLDGVFCLSRLHRDNGFFKGDPAILLWVLLLKELEPDFFSFFQQEAKRQKNVQVNQVGLSLAIPRNGLFQSELVRNQFSEFSSRFAWPLSFEDLLEL